MVHAALLYQGHDWFAQRLTLDQGAGAGLRIGLPVVDADGLVGQLTRVYPGSSEVTLVSSAEQLTPVFVERTGQRGLAAGSGHDQMELRYMPSQTDLRPGDRLLTSGIDRVYPRRHSGGTPSRGCPVRNPTPTCGWTACRWRVSTAPAGCWF